MSTIANLARTGRISKAPRILVYGPHKIGKSTFGAQAPNPIFIPIEDGLDALADPATGAPIEVPMFPQATTYDDVIAAIGTLYNEEHDRQSVTIDSLDWLENLIWKKVCSNAGVKNIEDIGYGKGYVHALDLWRTFLDGCNALRDRKGMAVILLAHAEIKRFDAPDKVSSYDRYQPKLHTKASGLVQEAVDVIGFANYEVVVLKEDVGFKKEVKKATGSGQRLLHLEERPAFLAGSRYRLPATVPFNWASFIAAFNAAAAPAPQPQ